MVMIKVSAHWEADEMSTMVVMVEDKAKGLSIRS